MFIRIDEATAKMKTLLSDWVWVEMSFRLQNLYKRWCDRWKNATQN